MHRPEPSSSGDTRRASRASVAAWVIYDAGNTTFFVGVMGLTFPLWITRVMGGNDATLGFTLAVAMAITFLISPVLGMLSDQMGNRMLFLTVFTLISVASTFLIGISGMAASLSLFIVAVVTIHTADIFYNTNLEQVSYSSNIGTIAGLGIGLGYLGAMAAIFISVLFAESMGLVFVIRLLSVVMLILMLPLLIMGRNRPIKDYTGERHLTPVLSQSIRKLVEAGLSVRKDRTWARFLLARFWYMWAVNAASAFAVLYAVKTVGLSEREVQVILLIGLVAAIPSGALWGKLVDHIGPPTVLKTAVVFFLVLLAASAIIPLMNLPGLLWSFVGVLSGIAVAGLYVSERPLIIKLAPSDRIGEYFGLNSMSGRLAAIAAPFSWGIISVTLNFGQIAALFCLVVCVALSVLLLAGLKLGIARR